MLLSNIPLYFRQPSCFSEAELLKVKIAVVWIVEDVKLCNSLCSFLYSYQKC